MSADNNKQNFPSNSRLIESLVLRMDLDPNNLTLWKRSWKSFLKTLILKKSADDNKQNLSSELGS